MSGGRPMNPEFGLTCGVCGKLYFEPRILPCLHTFCTRCIEGLDSYAANGLRSQAPLSKSLSHQQKNMSDGFKHQNQLKVNSLGSKFSNKDSAASGYESDKSPTSWSPVCTLERTGGTETAFSAIRTVVCPTCDSEVEIPSEGASHLPLHYVLQNKLLQVSLNEGFDQTISPQMIVERSACELCIGDVTAVSWCPDCSVGLCGFCSEAHKRQRRTEGHRTYPLQEALRTGLMDAARLRRSSRDSRWPVCTVHPTEELRLFCKPCNVTACRDCVASGTGAHAGHAHCPVSEVAQSKVADLRSLLDRALPKVEAVRSSLADVRATSKRIHVREIEVINEIDHHYDGYVKAIEEHRRNLRAKVTKSCEVKQRILKLQSIHLEQALEDLETSCEFVRQLLVDGTDVEVVTLLGHVGRKIQDMGSEKHRLEPRVDHFLQFVAAEPAGLVSGFPVRGVISAQRIAPHKCTIKGNGVPTAKQGRKIETLVVTKDIEGQPMRRGGANLKAELVSKEFPERTIPVKVIDRKDGTYQLSFKSDDAGLFWLAVKIQDKHVQGSPYPIPVKAKGTVHTGTYHCCTFCSSGGSKDAKCACRGTMPGGFKGCGHGHDGHPGKRHWSCCGQTDEATECTRSNTKILQFTL